MIKVTLGNNLERKTVLVNENTTLRAVLEANNVDYTRGNLNIDGATLRPGDIDKTFASLGVTDKCWLVSVVKADNAT